MSLKGHTPNKSLGQHFLVNKKVATLMASQVNEEAEVMEIGPGTGNLTLTLLDNPNIKKLVAIEKDGTLISDLHLLTNNYKKRFTLVNTDATTLDFPKFIKDNFATKNVILVANLPYNVGTSIIIDLLEHIEYFSRLVVMLQSEVVDRLMARPNSKDYGKISALIQIQCDLKKLAQISPGSFFPPPKVFSSVIIADKKRDCLSATDYNKLRHFCSIAFRYRRKTLANNLKGTEYESLFPKIAQIVDISTRTETLSCSTLLKLALLDNDL